MKVNEATAFRLLSKSKDFGSSISGKESTAYEDVNVEILGVPCIVRFGFSSSKNLSPIVTSSCVWIFGSINAFFGSSYFPVSEDSLAPSILNSTIDHAIEQAKSNTTFQTMKVTFLPEIF